MADQFSENQLQEFREAFNRFDRDANGFLDTKDVSAVMSSLGVENDEAALKDELDSIDNIGNGKIDFSQFLSLVKSKQDNKSNTIQALKDAFKAFDKDGNKSLSPDELRQMMISVGQGLSEEELNEMIKEADVDGDGQINYEEFVKMMDK